MKLKMSYQSFLIIIPSFIIGFGGTMIGYNYKKHTDKITLQNKIAAQIYQTNLNNTIDEFLLALVTAESYYQSSCNSMIHMIKLAAEMEQRGDSRYILRMTFKDTDLSNITQKAKDSYSSYKESMDFFNRLNSDTNNLISREFKESYVEYGQIIENNVVFCDNMDDGEFNNETLSKWGRELNRSKILLSMLDIESKKLLSYKK